jgi:hypothetical protein
VRRILPGLVPGQQDESLARRAPVIALAKPLINPATIVVVIAAQAGMTAGLLIAA